MKSKKIALMLVVTMLMTAFPFGLVVSAEGNVSYTDFNTAVEGFITDMTDGMDPADVKIAFRHLESRLTAEGGVSALQADIEAMTEGDSSAALGTEMTNRFLAVLTGRAMTKSQAAQVAGIFMMLDADAWTDVFDMLDAEDIPSFVTDSTEITAINGKMIDWTGLLNILEANIDNASLNAYLLSRALGGAPAFVDAAESGMALADISSMKSSFDTAFTGIGINGADYDSSTSFNNIFATWLVELNGITDQSEVKNFFSDYNLLQNADPSSIRLAPYLETMRAGDTQEPIDVSINLFNNMGTIAELGVGSFQFTLNYSPQALELDKIVIGDQEVVSDSMDFGNEIVLIDNDEAAGEMTMAVTTKNGGINESTESAFEMVEAEFFAIEAAPGGFTDVYVDNLVFLDASGQELQLPAAVYDAFYDIKLDADFAPFLSDVSLDGDTVSEGDTITLYKDSTILEALIDPYDANVTINGTSVQTGTLGQISWEMTGLSEGDNTVTVLAANSFGTDDIGFTIIYNAGPEGLVETAENLADEFVPEILQPEVTAAYEAYQAAADAVSQMPASLEKTGLENRLSVVASEIDSAQASLFEDAETEVTSAAALVSAFDAETTQEDIDAAQSAKDAASAEVDSLTSNDYSSLVNEAVKKVELVNSLVTVQTAIDTAQDDLYQRQADEAAAGVTSIEAPAKDATELTLPLVDGYAVTIKTSSDEETISPDGSVIPPYDDTDLVLVLTLVNDTTSKTADTAEITVTVPQSSKGEAVDAVNAADADSMASSLAAHEEVLGLDLSGNYENLVDKADVLLAVANGQQYSTVEEIATVFDAALAERVEYEDSKDIITFEFEAFNPALEEGVEGTVDPQGASVSVIVPYGTDTSNLIPTFTISEDAIASPLSGHAVDFGDAAEYTVTAMNGSTRVFTVTVVAGDADTTADLSGLSASAGGEQIDISPAFDSAVTSYSAIVGYDIDFAEITATPQSPLSSVEINGQAATGEGVTIEDLSFGENEIEIRVTAQDGVTEATYSFTVTRQRNAAAAIESFVFEAAENSALEEDASGEITGTSIEVTVPHGTDVSALLSTITLSDGAEVAPASGEVSDFTGPATYTVTAQDGQTTDEYTVTVSEADNTEAAMLSFVFEAANNAGLESDVVGVISGNSVSVSLPHGTVVSALVPTIRVSEGSSLTPGQGSADFSGLVEYEVLSQDGSATSTYGVSVSVMPALIVSGATNKSTVNTDVTITGYLPGKTITISDGSRTEEGDGSAAMSFTSEGEYDVSITASDGAGSETLSFTIDKTAPGVSINGAIDGRTYENPENGVTPSFSFTGNYEDEKTSVLLNGKTFEQGSTIKQEGDYVLAASATDKAGNTATESVSFSIAWDMEKPKIDISGAADKGVYESAAIDISLSGGSNSENYTYEAVLSPGGAFTSGTEINEEGVYVLDVLATNPSYTDVFSTKQISFEIDSANPTAEIDIADGASYNGAVVPGVTLTDTVASGAYLREHATVTLLKDGILTPYDIGDPLSADGSYTLRVKAVDRFGHESETAQTTFEIDTQSPVVTITGAVDGATYREGVTLSISTSEIADISVQKGEITGSGFLSFEETTAPYTFEGTPGEIVTYQIIATAEDAAGNTGQSEVMFTVDQEPVNIVITGVANGGIYNADRAISISAYDADGLPVEGTQATLDAAPFAGGTVSDQGSYTLVATNGETTKTVGFTIDKTAPAFISDGFEKAIDDGYSIYNVGDILKVSAVIAGAGGTEKPYFTVGSVSGRVPMAMTASGPGSETWQGVWMVPGGNFTGLDVTIWAKDAAGNTASDSLGTINVDNTAPSVTRTISPESPDGMNGYYTGDGFSVLFEAGATDRINVEVNGANGLGDTGSFTLDADDLSDETSNIIKYYATDAAGNTSSLGTFNVRLDETAPADPQLDGYSSTSNKMYASLSGSVAGEGAKTGSRVILLEGTETIAAGSIAVDDSFTIDGIVLKQGTNSFKVIAEDIAGNRSGSVSAQIDLDMVAPNVAIEKTDATHYTLEFDEDVLQANVTAIFNNEVKLVSAGGAPNTYTVATEAPEEGANTLLVFAEDAAGNIGRGAYTWQYIPPAVDIYNLMIADGVYIDIPAGAFDSATMMRIQSTLTQGSSEFGALMSPIDFIFGQDPAEPLVLKFFVGTGRSGMVMFHYDPETMTSPQILYAIDALSSSFPGFTDFSAALENQPYYILDTGFLVIKTRNFSEYNPAVDITAPAISISSTDFEINAADAAGGTTLSGTLSDMDPAAHVESVKINGVAMDISGQDTDKSFSISLTLAQGDSQVVLRAVDTAGNQRDKTLTYSVDTVVPDISASAAKTLTNGETGTISVTPDEDVSITINGSPEGSISGITEFTVSLANNQANIFTISGSDALGNTDTETVTITRDSTAPVLSAAGISDGDVIGTDKTITVTSTEGTASVKLDGVAFVNGSVYAVAGKDGAHAISAEATDAAGNKGTLDISFTVDTAVPSITITGAENGETYNNNRTISISTDTGDLDYTFTVKDASGNTIGTRTVENGGLALAVATDVSDGEYGNYTFEITATKTVEGVEKTASATIAFIVDRVYPVLTVSAPVDGSSTTQSFTEISGNVNIKSNIYVNNVLKIYGQEAGDFTISGLSIITGANSFEIKAVSFTDAAKEDVETISVTKTSPVVSAGGGGGPTSSGLSDTAEVGATAEKAEFLNSEVVMDFAAGTFDGKTDITVTAVDVEEPELYGQSGTVLRLGSSVFEFDAEGETFGQPVTVTFAYNDISGLDNPQKLGVYLLDEETGTWIYVGGKVDPVNNTVTIVLDHFSTYGVMLYEKAFTDTARHWAASDIGVMASRHIANGMTESTFAPEGTITRSQFATLLVRAIGLTLVDEDSAFGDVAAAEWYRQYVMTAYRAGLVNGMGGGNFAPESNITREQMAVMIMRAYNELKDVDYMNIATTAQVRFNDQTSIASWASHAVLIANDLGIINGMTADKFAPAENATRAQAIVMIKRLLEAAGEL
ncbi:MAG TPA: S-layer homology domain-containing protein [Clostridia bacterium]|nr:S-layer homology domain-containing protein [Clostridia bacterium]